MTSFLTNRDGGKTNEEGHIRFQSKVWAGNVASGLTVVARDPLAMGVDVEAGDGKIDYSDYCYTFWTDDVEAVSIATADPSNPRIDRVVAYVDLGETPSTANSNNPGLVKFKSVAGTPASSPSRPSDVTVQASVGAGNPYIDLADVTVGAGVTTISEPNITDTREMVSLPENSVPNSALQSGIQSSKLSNDYKFSVWRTAALDMPAAASEIVFDTEDYDTGNNFDTSTGRFTAPIDGYYSFAGAFLVSLQSGDHVYGGLYKNGAEYRRFFENTKTQTNNHTDGLYGEMHLEAGDTIAVYYSAGASGRPAFVGNNGKYFWFTGHLISAS